MKKIILILSTLLVAAGISAQNKILIEDIKPFSAIQVNGKIELFVTQNVSQPVSMSIDMNGNDANQLKWWDTEGAFQIKYTPKSKGKPVIIKLNCHTLSNVELTGVSMVMESTWKENIVTITMSSNAKLTAEIEAKDLKVTTQTSSTAVIKGAGRYADFDIRSKSVLDARDYVAESTTLRAAGYSESYIYAKERIIIEALDGASVFYRGTPEIFRERVTRGGRTNPIGK